MINNKQFYYDIYCDLQGLKMGNKSSKKKEKAFKNKKKDKINSKKFGNKIIENQMNDIYYDIISSDTNDEECIDISIDNNSIYTNEYLNEMKNYLDTNKDEIEDTYSFIVDYLEQQLNKTGIYYSIKLRCKSGASSKKKLIQKINKEGYKIQDIIGIRILVNFVDDIEILKKIFKNHVLNILESQSVQEYKSNEFGIMKTNYVWNMNIDTEEFALLGANEEQVNQIKKYKEEFFERYPFDQTFEIQVRTSTFDSYHEIDHEMRYKNDNTWDKNEYPEENRRFNGILATLEICDWSMSQLIDDMAHIQYINKNWIQMFQHRYKIKIEYPQKNSDEEKELLAFCNELNNDNTYAHSVYKLKRNKLITYLWNNKEDNDEKLNYHILIKAIRTTLTDK